MGRKIEAPAELQDDALLEWERLATELESLGLLNTADRALMVLHCQTWAVNQQVYSHVLKHGPTVRYSNGDVALTAEYKAYVATTKQLATMLKQLGLTPAARGVKATSGTEQVEELDY